MRSFCSGLEISVSTAFVIFLLTFLSVCGIDNVEASDQDNSMPLIDSCELISKAEAEKIMGTALKEGQQSENKVVGQKICLQLF